MRDRNLELEAARYQPEPGTRLLTSAVMLGFVVLCATLLMAGIYLQAAARMAAR